MIEGLCAATLFIPKRHTAAGEVFIRAVAKELPAGPNGLLPVLSNLASILLFVAAFMLGALTKVTDIQTDEKLFFFRHAQYVTGIMYGIVGGILLVADGAFSTVFFGVLIAVLASGKINRLAHQLAIAAVFAVVAFAGLPKGVSFPLVATFAFFGTLDEWLNDEADRRSKAGTAMNAIAAGIADRRLSLEVAALAASVFTGEWTYMLGIAMFDIGYIIANKFFGQMETTVGSLGNHLAIDCFDCSPNRLGDEKLIGNFLLELTKSIGMEVLEPPVVRRVRQANDEGISGIVMIKTSHISIHTFPRIHSCNVDIFSCRDFDANAAEKAVREWFGAKVSKVHLLERGEVF